ncbi:MAG TPA: class I SAM-dependent rRNA methyltransferase [Oscillospiraceae bacterium]|mgnify:CR=1 FL=1|nr:class I SAM-dependent rRNA methyltransferase [Oscillospiraceae bacterium]HPS34412.1 class I SAM-dependent rRNA methyltransferase [Oscillospiraceae bacterium]
MKTERRFPAATVTRKAETALRNGHPWVYGEEITNVVGTCENGGLIDVLSEKGTYLGTGLLSEKSKIRIRVLAANANETFGDEFFSRRLKYAIDYRITVMRDDFSCCRLVFGEADGLPGLTIDRYNDILVSQILSFGMEQRKDMIYRELVKILNGYGVAVSGIFERDDVAIRELEGLPLRKGWYENKGDFISHPESAVTEITENGIKYAVDVENGQKTGFFLDQKYNRAALARIAKGRKVLDCFTHTGSFGMNALMGGATHATAVDVSESALELAKRNAEKNSLSGKMDFICADVFDLLPKLREQQAGHTRQADYDLIILDPPAFTKSRKTVAGAEKGYREINSAAMKLLPRGGYLATCSCSHFMTADLFVQTLLTAASDANVTLKLIEARKQSPDHPILLTVPETDYLKFYLFQVI